MAQYDGTAIIPLEDYFWHLIAANLSQKISTGGNSASPDQS
jgi:hypothetical protein